MKRSEFIESRMHVWTALQKSIGILGRNRSALRDESVLFDFVRNYRRTIADCSLLRSLFPGDPVIHELNVLLCRALLIAGRTPLSDRERMARFYGKEFPRVVIALGRFFAKACLIFFASATVGFFITIIDPFFANAINGDEYTYMTIDNIQKGTPFAVYRSQFKYAMSGFIMANNIKVAFYAFAGGLFYGVGTFLILISNGLMLGSIAALFAHHHLLGGFLTTVMIHGTLELFAIMAAGAAGLRLGESLYRPGTLSRKRALARFGSEAFIMTIAMAPVFIIAGLLEGYVTPLDLPLIQRCAIIGAGALFLTAYLGIPVRRYLRQAHPPGPDPSPPIRMKL